MPSDPSTGTAVAARARARHPSIRRLMELTGLLIAGLLLIAAGPAVPAATLDGWSMRCTGDPGARRCTISARPDYADNRGGKGRLTVALRADAGCTTLHVEFDRAIDVRRPVLMRVDGGPVRAFHTAPALSAMARQLDEGLAPALLDGTGPDAAAIDGFWRDISTGRIRQGAQAAEELVARFALVKEEHKLGVGCQSMARLLPELRRGSHLRLSFHLARPGPRAVYHWPALDRREVVIPISGLAGLLESVPALR